MQAKTTNNLQAVKIQKYIQFQPLYVFMQATEHFLLSEGGENNGGKRGN